MFVRSLRSSESDRVFRFTKRSYTKIIALNNRADKKKQCNFINLEGKNTAKTANRKA